MEDNSISFLKSHKFYGEFEIEGCKNKYTGHLVYTPKKEFYLDLIGNDTRENIFIRKIKSFSSNDIHKTKKIRGSVFCEETRNHYNVSLFNTQATFPLHNSFSTTRIFFTAILFIDKHFEKENLKNIEFQYSGLEDFCCPELYKERIPYNRDKKTIKFGRMKSILFNENYRWQQVNENFFQNNLIASKKISNKDFHNMCSNLNKIISPYKDNLYLNKGGYHSLVVSYPVKKIEDITSLNYLLKNVFMCLTDNFTMNTEFVTLNYEKGGRGYLLFPEMIAETQKTTKYPWMPFWQGTFDDNEWKTIFKNLFQKKKLLDNFFFILSNNARGEYLTQYSLVRSIDGLKAIGMILSPKTKTAYTDAIQSYTQDLTTKERKYFDKFLENSLKYITLTTKEASKPDVLASKIRKLRAFVEHFYDYPNDYVNLETLADLVYTFDFIIKDFVFKELGISNNKRLLYKRSMLHLYKILPTSYPKRKMYK